MKNLTQIIRSTGISLIIAATITFPNVSHAGWFSSKPAPIKKVTKAVKAAPGNIQDKIADVSKKLNEIHGQMDASRPLADAMKNGQMMKQLTEVVKFLNESQSEYQDFADNGVDFLRQDINNLVGSIRDISNTLNLDGQLVDQLQKAADMVEKVPPTFLYPIVKAGIDTKLQDIANRMTQLSGDLVMIATLPPEKDAFLYPESYKAELCPLVNDPQTKIQLAVLGARMNTNLWQINTMSAMVPEDLTINVTVVGGGGATVAKFPLQYLFKSMQFVLETIQLRIDNYTSIAGSMCDAG